jgi:hypothetical protein
MFGEISTSVDEECIVLPKRGPRGWALHRQLGVLLPVPLHAPLVVAERACKIEIRSGLKYVSVTQTFLIGGPKNNL